MTLKKAALCICAYLIISPTLTTPAHAQDDAEASKPNLWGHDWSGRISFGGFLTDGNSQTKSIAFDGFTQARDEKNRYKLGGELRFQEDEGEETQDEGQIYLEYDRFITEKLFAGARASYEFDDIADLDRRIQLGPFVGYQYYESDPLNLSTRIGLDYLSEDFANGDSDESVAASWGLDYDQKFVNDVIQIFYKHELTVPLDNTEGFIYDGETGIRFPVAKVLTGSFQIEYDFDNDPADGAETDDTRYSLKIGYEF